MYGDAGPGLLPRIHQPRDRRVRAHESRALHESDVRVELHPEHGRKVAYCQHRHVQP